MCIKIKSSEKRCQVSQNHKEHSFWMSSSFFTMLLMLFFVANQSAIASNKNIAEQDRLSISMLEMQYDIMLSQALDRYFESSTFMLATKIHATVIIHEQELPEVKPQETRQNIELPGVPRVPAFMFREEARNNYGVIQVLPPQKEIRLDSILVNITIDPKVSDEYALFMVETIKTLGRLKVNKGDKVYVSRRKLPAKEIYDEPLVSDTTTNDTMVGQLAVPAQGSFLASLNWFQTLLLFLFAIVLIALILLLLQKKLILRNADILKTNLEHLVKKEEVKPFRLAPISYISNLILKYPVEIARLFDHWALDEGQLGVKKMNGLWMVIDAKLIQTIKPLLNKKSLTNLDQYAKENKEGLTQSEISELAQWFNSREKQDSFLFKFQPLNDFDFVSNMDVEDLLLILPDYDEAQLSLIVGHLPLDKAYVCLNALGSISLETVIRSIPKTSLIRTREYKDIALAVYNEYQKINGMKGYSSETVENVAQLLGYLPSDDLAAIKNSLANDDNSYLNTLVNKSTSKLNTIKVSTDNLKVILNKFSTLEIAVIYHQVNDALANQMQEALNASTFQEVKLLGDKSSVSSIEKAKVYSRFINELNHYA